MKVGICAGCYSLLHNGHVWYLQQAALMCDYLIALTNEDKYIENKKGCVPIPLKERMYILSNIKGVDEVGTFQGFNEHFWLSEFRVRRLRQEFGENAELIVFHTDELKNATWLPGQQIADKIIFIPKNEIIASVSDIFETIKEGSK